MLTEKFELYVINVSLDRSNSIFDYKQWLSNKISQQINSNMFPTLQEKNIYFIIEWFIKNQLYLL